MVLQEKLVEGDYERSWALTYKLPFELDQAIVIPNMGLFFLNLFSSEEGNLHGHLIIVNTRMIAQQFNYCLEITNNQSSVSYKGMVNYLFNC